MSDPETPPPILDLRNPDVITKYKTAAEIVNKALNGLITKIVANADVSVLCQMGDLLINKQCEQIYKKKKLLKGIAFPTCISLNNCVCHFSPYPSESVLIKQGDIVKIDMGCHIDGFIVLVAHTVVVPIPDQPEITGPIANVIMAAKTALDAVQRVIKPGVKNSQITAVISNIAKEYGVETCQGVLTHQLKQFIIDGNKVVIEREEVDQKVEEFEFELYETYAVDIVMTNGTGKPREEGTRTTIFKRAVDETYLLKLKASRYVISEINQHFPTLPFNLRYISDEGQAKLGVKDCVSHNLLHSYPVLYEKDGSFVAHFKTTILITPNGVDSISKGPELTNIKSDVELSPETKAILELIPFAKSTKKN